MKVYEYDRTGGSDDGMFVIGDPRLRDPEVRHGRRVRRLPANPVEGYIVYYSRTYSIPGLGSGPSGDSSLTFAAVFASEAEARKAQRPYRQSYPVIIPLAEAREFARLQHLARSKAKARKVGKR